MRVNQSYLPYQCERIRYLFLGGEVIDNVEKLPDLLGCLAFDHVGNSLAAHVAVEDVRNIRGSHSEALTGGA
jgi:hypothetical protein